MRAELRGTRIQECRIVEAATPSLPQQSGLGWVVKVDRLAYLNQWQGADWAGVVEVIVVVGDGDIEEFEQNIATLREVHPKVPIRLALPILTREWERPGIFRKAKRMLSAGYTSWEVSSLGGTRLLRSAAAELGAGVALTINSDWPLYALNRSSIRGLIECGVQEIAISPENHEENVERLLLAYGDRLILPLYTDVPLYLSETCPDASVKDRCSDACRRKDEGVRLHSEKGHVLVFHQGCRTIVLNHVPYCVASRLTSLCRRGLQKVRADFVWRSYRPDDVVSVWRRLRAGERVAGYDPWDLQRQNDLAQA